MVGIVTCVRISTNKIIFGHLLLNGLYASFLRIFQASIIKLAHSFVAHTLPHACIENLPLRHSSVICFLFAWILVTHSLVILILQRGLLAFKLPCLALPWLKPISMSNQSPLFCINFGLTVFCPILEPHSCPLLGSCQCPPIFFVWNLYNIVKTCGHELNHANSK